MEAAQRLIVHTSGRGRGRASHAVANRFGDHAVTVVVWAAGEALWTQTFRRAVQDSISYFDPAGSEKNEDKAKRNLEHSQVSCSPCAKRCGLSRHGIIARNGENAPRLQARIASTDVATSFRGDRQ
jgi:hypothetical protein